MAGLYVHIPFCAKKCHYCDFVVSPSGDGSKHARFLSAFETEAAHHAVFFEGSRFETLYLGGGTPSTLRENEMGELFSLLKKYFLFGEGAEVTLEANPGDVSLGKAQLYRRLGVNRVSLGAQSFSEATLKRLNRSHGAAAIGDSFRILRQAGFSNINLDLMLALPGENLDDVRRSLDRLAALGPEHVSLYELVVEEKTVFGKLFRQGALALPAEDAGFSMLSTAREYLKSQGYVHYELLNYARPGFESRHNLLYWRNGEYLGLGPGAFSYYGGRRFRSSASYEEYLEKMEKGDWTAHEEESLGSEQKEIESLLLSLRLSEGAPVARFARILGRLEPAVGDLLKSGLLERRSDRLALTERGKYLAESVFTELSKVY